jgi:chromatin remodeling complex protein RSC6
MSDVEQDFEHAEVPETGPVSVDDVLQAIQQKNIGRAKAAFGDVMSQKVNDALENEKVRVASQIFNNAPEEEEVEEPEEVETDAELEDEEVDVEAEVEAAFDEEDTEV